MTDAHENFIQRVQVAEQSGDLHLAVQLLRDQLAAFPGDGFLWAWLGQLENDREQFTAAIEALEHAIRLKPTLAIAHSQLAQALIELRRFGEARAALLASLALEPSPPRYVLLGYTEEALNSDAAAIEAYRQALEMEADNEEAAFNLAVLLRPSDPIRSMDLLRKAIRTDPLFGAAHRELGFSLIQDRESWSAAEHELQTALAIDGDDFRAHLYLGNLNWKEGHLGKAEQHFRLAIEISPNWGLGLRAMGEFLEATDRAAESRRMFERAAVADPPDG